MQAQVLNNCQGPHYIQLQKSAGDNRPPPLLILRPGITLVDVKVLAAARKANAGFDALFHSKIQPTKAVEADPRKFGKPMLEVVGKELPDKQPLASLTPEEAKAVIALTEDTDLLSLWRSECDPAKNGEIIKAIGDRIKEITSQVAV